MDDAGKYQQRMQAIAEKRRQQEEEERAKKEMEEEWLKQAQQKRKSLRDQWLSEPVLVPAPAPASTDGPGPEEPTEEDQTESQRSAPEEEEEEEEEGWTLLGEAGSINCTYTQNHSQAATEEDVIQQVIRATEGLNPVMMSQRMLRENGQDARSVLGMVAVQVERDPKTGATVIRSVAPVSALAGVPGVPGGATTVFDDGRKSVHAIGGPAGGGGPSPEELGQVLSALDDVGMRVLLDEVTVGPPGPRTGGEEVEREEEEGAIADPTSDLLPQKPTTAENVAQLNSAETTPDLGAGEGTEGGHRQRGGEEDEDKEGEGDVTPGGREREEGEVEYRLDQGPVTLTFLGYAEAGGAQGLGLQDNGEVLTVELVVLSDGGGEEVKEEETASPPSQTDPPSVQEAPATETHPLLPVEPAEMEGGGGGGETLASPPGQKQGEVGGGGEVLEKGAPSEVVFQDVPLDGNGAGVPREGAESPDQAPPTRAEGEVAPKHKTCQCCSVM